MIIKIFALTIILIILINLSSSYELALSPSHINYSLNANEELCKNITIFSKDYRGEISSMDKWAEEGVSTKNLNEYNLESSNLGINIEYQKSFILSDKKDFNVCITAAKKGSYQGALLFQADNMTLGVGSWLNLLVEDNSSAISNLGLNIFNNISPINIIVGEVLFIDFIAVLFLSYLLFLTRKKI